MTHAIVIVTTVLRYIIGNTLRVRDMKEPSAHVRSKIIQILFQKKLERDGNEKRRRQEALPEQAQEEEQRKWQVSRMAQAEKAFSSHCKGKL